MEVSSLLWAVKKRKDVVLSYDMTLMHIYWMKVSCFGNQSKLTIFCRYCPSLKIESVTIGNVKRNGYPTQVR